MQAKGKKNSQPKKKEKRQSVSAFRNRCKLHMNRSRHRMKKLARRTPSGRTSLLTKNKKPKQAHCALCRKTLGGVPRESRSGMRKLSQTQRRPERSFGGVLCANCTANVIKTRTRLQSGVADESLVPLTVMKYVKMLKA